MRSNINAWLRYLIFNEDGFFGIGQGPSGDEKRQFGEIRSLANFATGTGEKDIGAASNFWQSILSGDPSKTASVLGPEISGMNKQNQQKKKTTAEFGNRGGGTNASMQAEDESTRGAYNSILSSLTGSAASNLGSMGGGLLSTGLAAHGEAFDMSRVIHDQNEDKWKDLFKSIGDTLGTVGSFLPGKLGQYLKGAGGVFKG